MFTGKRVSVIMSDASAAEFFGLEHPVPGEYRWTISGRVEAIEVGIGFLIQVETILNQRGRAIEGELANEVFLIPWPYVTTVRVLDRGEPGSAGFKVRG
jgi:hypothetical protein